MRCLTFAALLVLISATVASAAGPVTLHVAETAGIRRTTFPVNARVPFPRGELTDAAHARLMLNGTEVPAQYLAEAKHPDGSVQWLDVDFNVSIGPLETAEYQIEYGPNVTQQPPPRGLTVTDGPEQIQVGNVTFNKHASPLILSAKYRDEDIGQGANGVSVVDAAGVSHPLTIDQGAAAKVVKPGPLYVVLQWDGQLALGADRLPFVVSAEMPSSKSWVKVNATVTDRARRLREIAVSTPLSLGAFPWTWDFGTPTWTYGVLRAAADQVTLRQTTTQNRADWHVDLAAGGRPAQVVESGSGAAAQWGHIQGTKEVVALAIEHATDVPATSSVTIDGAGQLTIRVSPTQPATEQRLTVYEHFVATPVQIGAATSPSAILAPLEAVCDRQQYNASGVSPPTNAR